MTVILDANYMQTREETHSYLKEKLNLPDYYGCNLDALYDCLTELDHLEIKVMNYREEDIYVFSVLQVMEDARAEIMFI